VGTPREALDRYTVTIGALIQLNAAIAAGTDNQRLLNGIDAWIALLPPPTSQICSAGCLFKVFAQRGGWGKAGTRPRAQRAFLGRAVRYLADRSVSASSWISAAASPPRSHP
jgi:hypothetical protein